MCFNWKDPNDPLYDLVSIKWDKNGNLDINIPDGIDCFAKCPEIDMCGLGFCMLGCLDMDMDTLLSEKEFQAGLNKYLSFVERMLSSNGKEWVDKFDRDYKDSDGTFHHKDNKISFKEVIMADVSCSDFVNAQHYLCDRCNMFSHLDGIRLG